MEATAGIVLCLGINRIGMCDSERTETKFKYNLMLLSRNRSQFPRMV